MFFYCFKVYFSFIRIIPPKYWRFLRKQQVQKSKLKCFFPCTAIVSLFWCAVVSAQFEATRDCYYKESGRKILLKYADPIIGIDKIFFSKLHVSWLIAIGDCILKLMHRSLNLLSADDAVREEE